MASFTPEGFVRHLGKVAADASTVQHRAMTAGAQIMKASIVTQIGAVAPGMRLRGVGKKGGRVGARYQVYGQGDGTYAAVSATGPVHLIERDVGPHRITGVRNRRKKASWATSGTTHPYAASPGTHGKHPFAKGEAVGARVWAKAYDSVVAATIERSFGF